MAGPAMIEGGGLGVYTSEEVGPMSVQVPNGVVDCLVEDEREAAQVARKLMSYFQGSLLIRHVPISGYCDPAFPKTACAPMIFVRSSALW